ncbi:MAG: hypothetical protein AAFV43_13525 [Planctomycetota bacterium]
MEPQVSDTDPSPPESADREPRFVVAWLVFVVVATVGGALAGAVAGGSLGVGMGAAGMSMDDIQLAGQIAGVIAGLPVSYVTYRWSVQKFILRS